MKLALGTVQFGLDYGVANQGGKVPIKEVKSILDFARCADINLLDTASSYGNSEQVLGRVGVSNFDIITKTISLKSGVDTVIDTFYQSLLNLDQESVDGLLIHDIHNIHDKEFDNLFKRLHDLKQNGLVNKIGFSTYMPEEVDFLLNYFDFDLIQLPFNVFDNRLIQGGQLKALKDRSIEVHARSIFLQGILLNFDNLSDYFSTWKNQFDIYQSVVKSSGLSLLEYALNFVLNNNEIDKVLVGVNSKRQLQEIVQSIKNESKIKIFPVNNVNLLNPSLWKV